MLQNLHRIGLRQRIQLFALLLVTISAGGIGISSFMYERDRLFEHLDTKGQQNSQRKILLLKDAIDTLQDDTWFFAHLPPVQGIIRTHQHDGIDPINGESTQIWNQRLQQIGHAFMQDNINISMLRLLSKKNQWREIFRLNRNKQKITTVPNRQLQHKGNRPYIQSLNHLTKDQIHLSPFNLEQEHGQIITPYLPVVRTSTPIFDNNGILFGAVVLNLDLRPLFHTIKNMEQEQLGNVDYIIDNNGNILFGGSHPKQAMKYELGINYHIQQYLPQINRWLPTITDGYHRFITKNNMLIHAFVWTPSPNTPDYKIIALETTDIDVVLSTPLQRLLWREAGIVVILILIGGLFAAWGARRLTQPLTLLAQSAKAIADGEKDGNQLSFRADGELDELIQSFNNMRNQIRQREQALIEANNALEQRVEERTKSLRLLTEAVEQNPCSILMTNNYGIIEYVNSTFTTITGYSAGEALGNNPRMLRSGLTPPEYYHQMWQTMQAGEIWHGELQNRRHNGELYWAQSTFAPIVDEQGNITHFVSVQEDITERKQLSIDMEQARDAAEAAAVAKTTFLTTMSHEIRTPLNMVLGMGELLQESNLDAQQSEYVASLNRTGHHLFTLINNILDFSRLDEGHVVLDNAPFELRPLINDAFAMQKINCYTKGLQLNNLISNNIPEVVRGDSFRLNQVLINLLGNAVKFTDHGNILLEISCEQSDMIRFCISDTGPGIKNDKLVSIFDHFTQANSGAARRGGTGLGLAICKHLVDLMGGSIWAESNYGEGSRFIFTILLPEETQRRELPRPVHASINSVPLQVLAIDDNDDNLRLIELYLQHEHHHVQLASNGHQGLAAVQQGKYDVILMDLEMPEMDGLTTIRAIRAWEQEYDQPRTPIVVLTAHSIVEVRREAEAAGCDDYLSKPVRKRELQQTLARHGKPQKAATAPSNTPPTSSPLISATTSDLSQLDEDVRALLPQYLHNQQTRLQEMMQAMTNDDIDTVRIGGHSIKGTGTAYGLPQLSQLGAEVEQLAVDGKREQLAPLLDQLDQLLITITTEVNR